MQFKNRDRHNERIAMEYIFGMPNSWVFSPCAPIMLIPYIVPNEVMHSTVKPTEVLNFKLQSELLICTQWWFVPSFIHSFFHSFYMSTFYMPGILLRDSVINSDIILHYEIPTTLWQNEAMRYDQSWRTGWDSLRKWYSRWDFENRILNSIKKHGH